MSRLLPPSSSPDVGRIVLGRTIRGFADGFVSVLLAQYLTGLGFSPVQVGAIVTGTLIGSAVLTLGFSFTTHRYPLRSLLLAAAALMIATGLGFATIVWFWPLLAIAAIGTLNPSADDVSVFLPNEQALVAGLVDTQHRPRLFAVYNLFAIVAGALGALASVIPEVLAHAMGWDVTSTQRVSFLVYALAGFVIFLVYRKVTRAARRSRPHRRNHDGECCGRPGARCSSSPGSSASTRRAAAWS